MARKAKETVQKSGQQTESEQQHAQAGHAATQEQESLYRSRCGGALRTARENQGLSVQDIANRLRLGAKQIEALEADDFEMLPEPTIVRGFIRNYAKLLKIGAEPLLDAYSVIVPTNLPHEMVVKPSANMKITTYKKPKKGNYLLIGLIVFLGLGAWIFYQNYVVKPSPTRLSEVMGSVEPLPEVALPVAERAADFDQNIALTLPSADTNSNAVPADTTQNTGAANSVQPLPAPAAVSAAVQPEASAVPALPETSGTVKLEFIASQETWVSVVDASGREVYNRTIFAGSRENINAIAPVNITVGNAGATSLSMNGKSIDLAPHSRNNVAHVKLEPVNLD